MKKLRVCDDLDEAGRLWKKLWPAQCLFDCWDIRLSFQTAFDRPIHFIVAEASGQAIGFMPLSSVADEEKNGYGFFPGETWRGRTWLEQNRIPAKDPAIRQAIWEAAPDNTEIRYMNREDALSLQDIAIDENGYILRPRLLGYDIDLYWSLFPENREKNCARKSAPLKPLVAVFGLAPGPTWTGCLKQTFQPSENTPIFKMTDF